MPVSQARKKKRKYPLAYTDCSRFCLSRDLPPSLTSLHHGATSSREKQSLFATTATRRDSLSSLVLHHSAIQEDPANGIIPFDMVDMTGWVVPFITGEHSEFP
jgi:hypothetical protein